MSKTCMLLMLAVALFSTPSWGDKRGGEVPAIRAALETLPGVRVVDVAGRDETWPFFGPEAIRADLQVGSSGRLLLCALTPEALSGDGPFIIARVGEWVPRVIAEGDVDKVRYVAGCPESVDVKPGAAFLEVVPIALKSPADVVRNYDRLHAEIGSWPVRPTRRESRAGTGYIEYWRQDYVE